MATSVRLDTQLEGLIDRLARQRGQTKSEVIRSALSALEANEGTKVSKSSPYEAIKHLIGCASGGPVDLSEETGVKFRELLIAQRKSR